MTPREQGLPLPAKYRTKRLRPRSSPKFPRAFAETSECVLSYFLAGDGPESSTETENPKNSPRSPCIPVNNRIVMLLNMARILQYPAKSEITSERKRLTIPRTAGDSGNFCRKEMAFVRPTWRSSPSAGPARRTAAGWPPPAAAAAAAAGSAPPAARDPSAAAGRWCSPEPAHPWAIRPWRADGEESRKLSIK